MSSNMQGKTLVISGGTKGIGKECVYKFASNGVNVAFTYNSNGEVAEEICKDVESKFGVKCKAYPFNILEPEKYSELFEEIDKDFDRVDFFISNAFSLKNTQKSLTKQGIFEYDPECGILQRKGNFKVYTDNGKFECITEFLESHEEWSYIHLTKKDFLLLEEMYGYYEFYNNTTIFKNGFTLTGHFKHIPDEVWCEITGL